MSAASIRWHTHPDRQKLERHVRDAIADRAASAIDARHVFSIVLAGGSTPRRLYASLATIHAPRWRHWHIYFSDERCLPRGDPGRNDTMAREVWLDRVGIPPAQIHRIPAELGADEAALAYRQTLRRKGRFDLVLLGLGADGHTASLFPGQPAGAEHDAPDAIAVHSAPKPPAARVSLSAKRLSLATAVFLLAMGTDKRNAIAALRAGENTVLDKIRPTSGIDAYVDESAFAS